MHVLITGAGGQLGRALAAVMRHSDTLTLLDREQLDVTDADRVWRIITASKPDTVIHSAAYTLVDKAETDVAAAYAVNAAGTRNVAAAAAASGSALVYISTDYVFSGSKGKPYTEFDQPDPISVYGKSKLEGERFVQMLHHRFFIVRTSWLYGDGPNNFTGKIVSAARSGKPLRVVDDEIGSPTSTSDLAAFLTVLIRTNRYGIYHASNTGSCSRFEQAKAILEATGLSDIPVEPIPGNTLQTAAPRPHYSVLDSFMIRLSGFSELPHWRDALTRCITKSQ